MREQLSDVAEWLEQATAITRAAAERMEGSDQLTECNMLYGAIGLFEKAQATLAHNLEQNHAVC